MTDVPRAGRKPRLLVLASTYPRFRGDHEPAFVHELARRLTAWFDVAVLCPHAAGAAVREDLDGVQVFRFRYAPARFEVLVNDGGMATNLRRRRWAWLLVPLFMVAQIQATWRLVRNWKPAAVHAHWLIPQGVVVGLLQASGILRSRYMLTSHGADLHALRGRPFVWAKALAARRAAAISVVSEGMRRKLLEVCLPAAPIHVAPMGVDLRRLFVPDDSVARSASEILFVGRLVEKKGLEYLIKALPLVLRQHPEATLRVVGFGPLEQQLKERTRALGLENHVSFDGPAPQSLLPDIYRRATVFVAPFIEAHGGDQEGLGLVAIEAIGCGCPAAVSAVPATVLVPAEKFSPGSVEEIAGVVNRIIALSPRDRALLAARMREQVLAEFDWSNVAARYAALLRQVAEPPNPRDVS